MFELGGLSSLRGFSFKEFVGDRLILANIEYNFSPAAFKRDILFLDDFRLILFSDIGKAWFAKDNSNFTNGFEQLTWHSLKSNLGFALTDWQGRIRLNIAKRTDTNRDPWEITFRIAKPF
jgi:outer membrane protein assembly factor BamA